ncbi:MAG TPA: hypothetical protein PLW02_05685 [Verrucomicrobiota bacterium]|nr:hypothetical protein [Verrucomicrobiota bacterium]
MMRIGGVIIVADNYKSGVSILADNLKSSTDILVCVFLLGSKDAPATFS